MNLAQGYMATKPTAVAEGNHEACTLCSPVPDFVGENGHGYNFTQCVLRDLLRVAGSAWRPGWCGYRQRRPQQHAVTRECRN